MLERVTVGQAEDDGTGDTLRDAFAKINANFDALVDQLVVRLASRGTGFGSPWPGELVPRHVSDRDPEEAPTVLGCLWLNVASGSVFVSVGTASDQDWKRLVLEDRRA